MKTKEKQENPQLFVNVSGVFYYDLFYFRVRLVSLEHEQAGLIQANTKELILVIVTSSCNTPTQIIGTF